MEPFLKWAGGKRWLAGRIRASVPAYSRYYEPFIGSGALFFALEPQSAVIADTNKELINCYKGVRNHCEKVISILRRIPISTMHYYAVRDRLYHRASPLRKAAYFIYLNKLSWNGLYRVNREGRFNVPPGRIPKDKQPFDFDLLRKARTVLRRATIICGDFEDNVRSAKENDLVYFDPPYVTTHLKNGFIKYNSKLFKQSDGLRLASVAQRLVDQGVAVLLSNASHPLIRQQYDGSFQKYEFNRSSTIAGNPIDRRKFSELVVSNFDLQCVDLTMFEASPN